MKVVADGTRCRALEDVFSIPKASVQRLKPADSGLGQHFEGPIDRSGITPEGAQHDLLRRGPPPFACRCREHRLGIPAEPGLDGVSPALGEPLVVVLGPGAVA